MVLIDMIITFQILRIVMFWDYFMLSEESYNNLMENIYVMGNKSNYDWLMESKTQLENGKVSAHELSEVEVDE